jgi:hypothetical protein
MWQWSIILHLFTTANLEPIPAWHGGMAGLRTPLLQLRASRKRFLLLNSTSARFGNLGVPSLGEWSTAAAQRGCPFSRRDLPWVRSRRRAEGTINGVPGHDRLWNTGRRRARGTRNMLFRCRAQYLDALDSILWLNKLPAWVGVVLGHCARELFSIGTEILLIYAALLIHDERHHARIPPLRRICG